MPKFAPHVVLATLLLPTVSFADLTHNQTSTVLEDQIVYLPVPPPPPPPPVPVVFSVEKPTDSQFDELQKAIAGTNVLRAEKNLPPLRYDENLAAYAQFRASEIVQKFSHERPNGQMYRAGMSIGRAVGENIAAGKATADETVKQFRDSPKHYATILHDKFTKIGMGLVHLPDTTYKYYWVQIFGADNTSSAYAFQAVPATTSETLTAKADTSASESPSNEPPTASPSQTPPSPATPEVFVGNSQNDNNSNGVSTQTHSQAANIK